MYIRWKWRLLFFTCFFISRVVMKPLWHYLTEKILSMNAFWCHHICLKCFFFVTRIFSHIDELTGNNKNKICTDKVMIESIQNLWILFLIVRKRNIRNLFYNFFQKIGINFFPYNYNARPYSIKATWMINYTLVFD